MISSSRSSDKHVKPTPTVSGHWSIELIISYTEKEWPSAVSGRIPPQIHLEMAVLGSSAYKTYALSMSSSPVPQFECKEGGFKLRSLLAAAFCPLSRWAYKVLEPLPLGGYILQQPKTHMLVGKSI